MTTFSAADRDDVVATCGRMLADGLVVGTSGNVSLRRGDQVLITPTAVDYRTLTSSALPVVDLAGDRVAGHLAPTSELPLHLAIYRAHPEAGALVHTHAVHATAVSTLAGTVPNVHYILASNGGAVRVAKYATYGTPELAESAVGAMEGRSACLLANHGTVTIGESLAAAYDRAVQLEWACRVWLAATAAGDPQLLSGDEMARVAEKLRGYRQPEAGTQDEEER
ncbi:MAG: class II aldolase/adducin family protein [Sciscionella sp.]